MATKTVEKTTPAIKEPEKPANEPKQEMTMMEKILKIENLQDFFGVQALAWTPFFMVVKPLHMVQLILL